MTREEQDAVDRLVRNALILTGINDRLIDNVVRLTGELAVKRCVRNEAVALASSWNPYRVWTS